MFNSLTGGTRQLFDLFPLWAELCLLSASGMEEKGVCAWTEGYQDGAMEGCCCERRMRSEGNGSIH